MAVPGPVGQPEDPFQVPEGGSAWGGGGGGGGGGFTGPFIPTFGQGGAAPRFGGFGPSPAWSQFQLRRRMPSVLGSGSSFSPGPGGGFRPTPPSVPLPGTTPGGTGPGYQIPPSVPVPGRQGGATPGGLPPLPPGQQYAPQPPIYMDPSGDHPFENGPFGPIGALLQQAFLGNMGYGGLFSPGAQGMLGALRGQMIQDSGAQQRAQRLGLQARGDIDPSTYGFQSLLGQVQGNSDLSKNLGGAQLALQQEQLQQYWNLLNNLAGLRQQGDNALIGANANQSNGWGQFLQGLGGLAGGLL